jgi:peptidoglycan/xylan/chitin deacetylase (PgdA/CDA1 family)
VGKDRRELLRRALTFTTGVAAGLSLPRVAEEVEAEVGPDRLPLSGGYAPGGVASVGDHGLQGDRIDRRGDTVVRWRVRTDKPLVALTFDDGPGPEWTPMVLDALDRHQAKATFFVVGERLNRHEELIRHRIARHELGNHTWAHRDLARLDEAQVRDQILRTHMAIKRVTGGKSTKVMRPPWGHLGGSALVLAEEFGYDVVMWSHQMREERFAADPPAQARDIVDNVEPGSIVLAHDVGDRRRLVALSQLDAIIIGLRKRGLEPVTVSELIAAASGTR